MVDVGFYFSVFSTCSVPSRNLTSDLFILQVDLADAQTLYCLPHRNSPRAFGDTSRRHSSIPRGNSIDKGAPLAAPESSSIVASAENGVTISDNHISSSLTEDYDFTEANTVEATTPVYNNMNNFEELSAVTKPLRRRIRENDSYEVPHNKHMDRVNSITKRSCHSLQVRDSQAVGSTVQVA